MEVFVKKPVSMGVFGVFWAAATVLGQAAPPAAEATPFVPFVIPWDDASPNVATDVSRLNNKALPRIVSRDGHFFEETTGKRVRFWATNFSFNNNFPERDAADKVAARLAKYGVNLVRLHHFDSEMAMSTDASIWDRTQEKKVIDPKQLDKLQYLIGALARNGVYVDLNLKVSKVLNKVDGAPIDGKDMRRGFSTNYQKKIDRFDRFLIDHQKEYAKAMLTTPNPYRNNLTAAEDPAIALVEINNENAAAGWPGEAPGANLRDLPEPYAAELKTRWTEFLRKKYGTQEKMLTAWKKDLPPVGTDILADYKTPWRVTTPGGAEVKADAQLPGGTSVFHVLRTSGTDWHVQAMIPMPDVQTGAYYTLEFEASASAARPLRVSMDRNGPTFENQGLSGTVQLGTTPSKHRLVFRAGGAENKRLVLQLGAAASDVTVSGVIIRPGIVGGDAFTTAQSIDSEVVALPADGSLPNIQRDWQRFMTDLDTAFADEMRSYLRNDLNVRAAIADTQMGWGGTGSLTRERDSDFADSHSYWKHPTFASGKWDANNWTVDQKSLALDALCQGTFGTLAELTRVRIAGKPFTVSEYDHPSPNDYVSEQYPVISTFAALQDWDAVISFTYGEYGPNAKTDRILAFFDNSANPAKWAFAPSAALIFRGGLVDPLASVAQLNVPTDVHADYWPMTSVWEAVGKLPNLLQYRLEIKPGTSEVKLTKTEGKSTSVVSAADSRYEVSAAKAFAVAGMLGGKSLAAGPFTLKLDAFDKNFASMTLVPLDDKPLTDSRHLLLTLVGRAENQEMKWTADRTALVGGDWGHGPIQIQRITGTLTGPQKLTIHPLSPTGTRLDPTSGQITGNTVWYELVVN